MPKVTFQVPDDLKRRMEAHPEINWSEVFRRAIDRQARAADLAEDLLDEMEDARVRDVAGFLRSGVGRTWKDAKARARRH